MSRSYRRDYSTFITELPKGSKHLNSEPHAVDLPSAGYGAPKRARSEGVRTYTPGKKQGLRFMRAGSNRYRG